MAHRGRDVKGEGPDAVEIGCVLRDAILRIAPQDEEGGLRIAPQDEEEGLRIAPEDEEEG